MRCFFESEGLKMLLWAHYISLPLVSHENTPFFLVSAHVKLKFETNVTKKVNNTMIQVKKLVNALKFNYDWWNIDTSTINR